MNLFQSHAMSSRVSLLVLTLITVACDAAQPPAYTITDLGKLPAGGYPVVAANINNSGQIVGFALGSNNTYRAFVHENGVLRDLGVGTHSSFAGSINKAGQITGTFATDWDPITVGRDHAFLYSGGVITDLSVQFGRFISPGPLNNHGDFVGIAAADDTTTIVPFTYIGGAFQILATATNRQYSSINDAGQILGTLTLPGAAPGSEIYHPAIFQNGKVFDLGSPKGAVSSIGTRINNRATCIGYTVPCCEQSLAFIYARGKFKLIDPLPGDSSTQLGALNSSDEAVGSSQEPDVRSRAILVRNGRTIDLNTLIAPNSGWQLVQAGGINDQGQIAASGFFGSEYHACLLTPVR